MADYIPLFFDWLDSTEGLSDTEKGRLVDAMVIYAIGGDWQDRIRGNEKFVFNVMKGQIDRHLARSKKLSESGAIGGKSNGKQGLSTASGGLSNNNNNNNNNNSNNENNNDTKNDNDSDIEANASCAEPGENARSTPKPEPTPSGFNIPLNDGTDYNVPAENIKVYRQLYPAVDVEQELRNIIGWCLGNPNNLKTRSGVKRFISGWLSREQNRSRPNQLTKQPISQAARFMAMAEAEE